MGETNSPSVAHVGKSGRVKIVVWVQISSVSEMIRSCRCIPHVSKMLVLTYNWGNSAIIESPAIQLKAVGETNSPSVAHVGYDISPLSRVKFKILTTRITA
jgi:hypothetical protein